MEETFWPNGNINSREYRNNNTQLHNEQGPALERWYENGQLQCQSYFINGQRHNEQGPAFELWYKNGKLCLQEYWIEGNKVTETELKSMIPSVKSASKS